MSSANDSVSAALAEIARLRRFLKRSSSVQVQSTDEKSIIRATTLAWFNNHRSPIRVVLPEEIVRGTDDAYKAILGCSDRSTSRTKYDSALKQLLARLSELRTAVAGAKPIETSTSETAPNFENLVADSAMRAVLRRRWDECVRCVEAGAPLASTVMMGGLLEALLLAKVHRQPDKRGVFGANSAPRDKKSNAPLNLQEWTLRNYIDVGHELKWISATAKDLGEVVRDYRNYIHPHKELTHGVFLTEHDARLFWEVAKGIARQVLEA